MGAAIKTKKKKKVGHWVGEVLSIKLCHVTISFRVLAVTQRVKDSALPQLWHGSATVARIQFWPGNFHMLHVTKKKKKFIKLFTVWRRDNRGGK